MLFKFGSLGGWRLTRGEDRFGSFAVHAVEIGTPILHANVAFSTSRALGAPKVSLVDEGGGGVLF